ncbi:hypothetical protein SAMN05216207_1001188 [Pseudonocardia ammonioxydans]|uniref:Uncharacterized protein n=1 Tax=Pseudonocardia ammonioxydans TaxID=260086 RepID=A0A1I4S205_PSUAM|nr:hypothetical protein [Pseudonocardia ammonioxydans]SFM58300.1 hypothetical protein SAMN05216207_1001188 [Pseudonocardia ammonioxydans]
MTDDQLAAADHTGAGSGPIGAHERRQAEIADRISALRARATAITASTRTGSTSAQVRDARARQRSADATLGLAYLRAAERHRLAAAAHERFADFLDESGDRERGDAHRQAAGADRAAAERDEAAGHERGVAEHR